MADPLRSRKFIVALAVLLAFSTGVYAVISAQKRAAEMRCSNNLKMIGLALANYNDTYWYFPAAHAAGHSWRIRCIPYMWASPQFEAYDFDIPWDSQNNITIHTRPLPGKTGNLVVYGHPYGPPCDHDDPDSTSYVLLVGKNAFADGENGRNAADITDGLANTIAAVEIADSLIHWLSPNDLDIDTMSFKINDGANSISSHHPTGPAVLFCDGAVFRMNPETPPDIVRAMCTIDGGENVSRDFLISQGYLKPQP